MISALDTDKTVAGTGTSKVVMFRIFCKCLVP